VRLALQADADVLNRSGQHGVGHTGEGTRGKVLSIGEVADLEARVGSVACFEPATSGVESAELNRDASADAQERRQCSLVECKSAFVLVDGGGGLEGA
jgi:hypothetical protein